MFIVQTKPASSTKWRYESSYRESARARERAIELATIGFHVQGAVVTEARVMSRARGRPDEVWTNEAAIRGVVNARSRLSRTSGYFLMTELQDEREQLHSRWHTLGAAASAAVELVNGPLGRSCMYRIWSFDDATNGIGGQVTRMTNEQILGDADRATQDAERGRSLTQDRVSARMEEIANRPVNPIDPPGGPEPWPPWPTDEAAATPVTPTIYDPERNEFFRDGVLVPARSIRRDERNRAMERAARREWDRAERESAEREAAVGVARDHLEELSRSERRAQEERSAQNAIMISTMRSRRKRKKKEEKRQKSAAPIDRWDEI